MSPARGVVLLKLGGSLITDKRGRETFRPRVVARLARELAGALPDLAGGIVVGHGAGSFGHRAAVRHGVGSGPLVAGSVRGIAAVQDRTAVLHRKVKSALLRAGVPAFSQSPSSMATSSAGRVRTLAARGLMTALDGGLVPVLHGDVVPDRAWRAAICSTEDAFLALARALRRAGRGPRSAVWLGVTDGVLDERRRTIDQVRAGDAAGALRHAGDSAGTDVTGGMAHRLRAAVALARIGVPSWIGDGRVRGGLAAALAGRPIGGTLVVPD